MLTERLQILIRPDQRALLDREAKRRDTSIGQIVRDAVDAEVGVAPATARQEALDRLLGIGASLKYLSVEEMNLAIDADREADFRRLFGGSEAKRDEKPGPV